MMTFSSNSILYNDFIKNFNVEKLTLDSYLTKHKNNILFKNLQKDEAIADKLLLCFDCDYIQEIYNSAETNQKVPLFFYKYKGDIYVNAIPKTEECYINYELDYNLKSKLNLAKLYLLKLATGNNKFPVRNKIKEVESLNDFLRYINAYENHDLIFCSNKSFTVLKIRKLDISNLEEQEKFKLLESYLLLDYSLDVLSQRKDFGKFRNSINFKESVEKDKKLHLNKLIELIKTKYNSDQNGGGGENIANVFAAAANTTGNIAVNTTNALTTAVNTTGNIAVTTAVNTTGNIAANTNMTGNIISNITTANVGLILEVFVEYRSS